MRIGGFGGVAGLSDYLVNEKIDLVLDATHPFAAQMARHAYEACQALGVPRAKLVRPPWVASPGDRWTMMPSVTAAAIFLRFHPAQRIFLTLGRQEIAPFVPLGREDKPHGNGRWFLTRMIDPPADGVVLPPGDLILGRGPFRPEDERALMQQHRIDLPASRKESASSAPRPNTKGSPPFSRSTRLPCRASSTSRSEMSRCFGEGLPPRLPAYSSSVPGRAQARIASPTRAFPM